MKRMHLAPGLLRAAGAWGLVALCACEPTAGNIEPGSHPASGRMAISADGSTLFVALADHDEVRAIDAATGAIKAQTQVAGAPHRLTLLSDGRVAVSSRHAGTVSILDAEASAVETTVEVGADPHQLLEADGHLVVAVSGQRELARIDLADPTRVKDRVALDDADPRGLARGPDGTLFVSHFRTPRISMVDLDVGVPTRQLELDMPANPLFDANQLESMTVSPDAQELVVPHQECNNDPVQFAGGAGSADLTGEGAMAYYAQGPTGYPAVLPAVSHVDLDSKVHLSDGPGDYDATQPGGGAEPAGAAPAVISPMHSDRIGGTWVNGPVATALADGGRLELVVMRGSGNVLIRRTRLGPNDRSLVAVVDVGVGASDIVLSPDGARAYVFNAFDYSVTEFRVPKVETTTESSGSSLSQFSSDGSWAPLLRPILDIQPENRTVVAESVLSSDVEAGRILFHSVTPNLTRNAAISCASCHPEGRDDGTTWHFAEGPRQTLPLWGGISRTSPLHWDNTFTAGMEDINQMTVQMRMGGEGLDETELSQLTAFIDSIPVPAAPMNVDDGSVNRGRDIFFSEEAACATCHAGTDYTDNQAHDVGTGWGSMVESETMSRFATPPLRGLAHTAPYFHAGHAATLRELVEMIADGRVNMGKADHLSAEQRDDLAAFLSTL